MQIRAPERVIILKLFLTAIRGKTGERLCREKEEPCGHSLEREGIHFPRLSCGITMMLTDACASSPPVARRQRVPLRVSSNFTPPC